MKEILKKKNKYVLRIDRGEEVISSLKDFCKDREITSASFTGIGAVNKAKLAWYDVENKEYARREIEDKLEITSFIGNVARMEGKTIIHAHGTFTDKNMQTTGGHVDMMVVSGTCEIALKVYEGEIERGYDKETGLNIMQ